MSPCRNTSPVIIYVSLTSACCWMGYKVVSDVHSFPFVKEHLCVPGIGGILSPQAISGVFVCITDHGGSWGTCLKSELGCCQEWDLVCGLLRQVCLSGIPRPSHGVLCRHRTWFGAWHTVPMMRNEYDSPAIPQWMRGLG